MGENMQVLVTTLSQVIVKKCFFSVKQNSGVLNPKTGFICGSHFDPDRVGHLAAGDEKRSISVVFVAVVMKATRYGECGLPGQTLDNWTAVTSKLTGSSVANRVFSSHCSNI